MDLVGWASLLAEGAHSVEKDGLFDEKNHVLHLEGISLPGNGP
jgi:hypothetical protein